MAKSKSSRYPRDKFLYTGVKLVKSQLANAAFMLEMPDEYFQFLIWRNGGTPPNCHFTWKHPDDGIQTGIVNRFFGFDPGRINEPGRQLDLIWAVLKFRDWLPRWSIPVGFANEDDFLITFSNYDDRAGQIWLKHWCHDAPDDDADPDAETFCVSGSFVDFVNALVADDED